MYTMVGIFKMAGRGVAGSKLGKIGKMGAGIGWGAGQDLGLRGPAAVRKMRHRSRVLYLCPIRVAPG